MTWSATRCCIRSSIAPKPEPATRHLSLERSQIVLLAALIADEQLDDAGLDTFLGSARKLADQLMS
jgi:hypothetical protein